MIENNLDDNDINIIDSNSIEDCTIDNKEEDCVIEWYVIHVYSGFEKSVKRSIEEYIKLYKLQDFFGEVLIPVEEIIEMRNGEKRKSSRKFFPGYILIQMMLNDQSLHLINSIPKVLGFIGGNKDRPVPISDKEANLILNRLEESNVHPKILFEIGEIISCLLYTSPSPRDKIHDLV